MYGHPRLWCTFSGTSSRWSNQVEALHYATKTTTIRKHITWTYPCIYDSNQDIKKQSYHTSAVTQPVKLPGVWLNLFRISRSPWPLICGFSLSNRASQPLFWKYPPSVLVGFVPSLINYFSLLSQAIVFCFTYSLFAFSCVCTISLLSQRGNKSSAKRCKRSRCIWHH